MAQPARPGGGFDMARMSTGTKILLAASILMFIDLFLPWSGVDLGEFGQAFGVSGNISGFSTGGFVSILLALVLIFVLVWEGLLAGGVRINMGTTSPVLLSAIGGGVAALLGLIVFLMSLDGIKWGAFIGLILALALAYGAYVRYNESRVTTPPPAV